MKRRAPFAVFNPEKFLAEEQKKSARAAMPTLAELLPVGFSPPFRRQLIERLAQETTNAFYRGTDRTRIEATMTVLRAEVTRELAALGIAPDPRLVQMLVLGVVSDPAWRRIAKKLGD